MLIGPPGTMALVDLEDDKAPRTTYRFYKLDKGMRVTTTKRNDYGEPDIQNVVIEQDTVVIPLPEPIDFKPLN